MKLGLMLHDPEEEHDCFSDNTHNSHYYDEVGMMTIYSGSYTRRDGSALDGAGHRRSSGGEGAGRGGERSTRTDGRRARQASRSIKDTADSGTMAYDQMIGHGNAEGNAMVQAADRRPGGADPRRSRRWSAPSASRSRSRAPTASTIRPPSPLNDAPSPAAGAPGDAQRPRPPGRRKSWRIAQVSATGAASMIPRRMFLTAIGGAAAAATLPFAGPRAAQSSLPGVLAPLPFEMEQGVKTFHLRSRQVALPLLAPTARNRRSGSMPMRRYR